jgi:hypothetical protein
MNPLTQSKNTTILPVLIALTLGCFGLSPTAQAVDPPPCCGYPGENTAVGEDALLNLTTGIHNTATGYHALLSNTEARNNTGFGWEALMRNTVGFRNTATGCDSLTFNTTGSDNAAHGGGGLKFNTTGTNNTANGSDALNSNTTGNSNTAGGQSALVNNTTGNSNTASGQSALVNNRTGSGNIALGASAGGNLTTGDNNIDIGNAGVAGESNTIRIGTAGTQTATFIAGIRGTPITGGIPVGVTADGQLGIRASSERFKEEVQPMDKTSDAILALKPVTFRYKRELDPEGIPQFGLVAEEVEKVNPDLVARDADGKAYTVRYEAVNAMLLNEFLKEHRKGQEQDATISQLKAELAQQRKDFQAVAAHQQKQIEALNAGLQKVSAQIELSKSAPETVLNNQ